MLMRKGASLFSLNPILARQCDSFNTRSNHVNTKSLSCPTLDKLKEFAKNAGELQSPKNSILTTQNHNMVQPFLFVDKSCFSSHVNPVAMQESYKESTSKSKPAEPFAFGLDPNDAKNKWVKEAMEVEHPSYQKLMTTYVSHTNSVVTFYSHKKTGLTVVSVKTNDGKKEMCFDVSAPTYQFNNRGCTHITEHSVLMRTTGHDTFNSFYYFSGGSYHSFLNALFFKNRTRYYFSSLNDKAFYQLADYFMDCFFRPAFLYDKDILKQEGWHYKVTKEDDKLSNTKNLGVNVHGRHITYSGIVYNEMKKRSFATPHNRGLVLMYRNLYTNSYKYDEGGNPEDIVDLTQTELADFYRMYYGPGTSTVYFHGHNDVYKRLNFVDDYMKNYNIGIKPDAKTGLYSHTASKSFVDKILVNEEFRTVPSYVKGEFPANNPKEDYLMMGWVLNPTYKGTDKYELDTADKLAFEMLKHMLLDSRESVLQKKVVESGLGTRVVGPGLEDNYPSYQHVTFVFGVEGVKYSDQTRYENAMKFEQVVFGALKELEENGFKRDAVEAALAQLEFKHKEQHYLMKEHRQGYYPKGLTLLRYVQPTHKKDRDPVDFLRFEDHMNELRRRVLSDDPSRYLMNLVRKHMLNNTTRVTLHLEAVESTKFEKEMNKKISEQLESRLSHLSREEVDRMEEEYKKFKEEREKPQDPKSYNEFPTVELSEFLNETKSSPTRFYNLSEGGLKETKSVSEATDVRLFAHKVDSNQVLYMDYAVPLDSLSLEEVRYMNLFCRMLNESGTDKLTPEEVSYLVDKNLGGLSFSTFFTTESNNETYDDPNKGLGYLFVRTKSLKSKTDKMVDVVNDLLLNANFSNSKKGLEVLRSSVSAFESDLTELAHEFTFRRMASKFSVPNYADEAVNGYSQLVFLKDTLLPLAEKDWKQVEERLNAMRQKLLSRRNLTVNLTGDAELVEAFLNNASSFYNRLSSTFKNESSSTDKVWVKEVLDNKLMEKMDKNELLVMPVRNNFVGVGGKLFSKSDKMSGEHRVVTQYVMRSFLYRYLRSSGSSYGAHLYLLNTGHVAMVSYADPNFLQTLEVYKKVPEELSYAYSKLNRKAVKMHILGTLGTMDKELHPVDKSLALLKSNLRGETAEFASSYRKGVLATTNKAFKELAEKFKSDYDWLNVCSLVNRASADTSPPTFKRLY